MGLALWLIPRRSTPASNALYEHLCATTRRLSAASASASESESLSARPSAAFAPHATLLAGLREGEGEGEGEWTRGQVWEEWMGALREWRGSGGGGQGERGAERAAGIECEVLDVSTRGKYFQSVFLVLSLPPALASLHALARTRLKQTHQPPYMPHVSLLYADVPAEEAQGVISNMAGEGWFERAGQEQRVEIRLPPSDDKANADADADAEGKGRKVRTVEFDRVELWDCTGDVAGWRCIRGVDL